MKNAAKTKPQLIEELKSAQARIAELDRLAKEKEVEGARLEAQLRQGQETQTLGVLASGIAHDFGNILQAMLGYLDLAKDELPETSPVRENLEEVYKGGVHARDLVRQILAFGRQDHETREPVSLGALVQESLRLLRVSLPSTIRIRQRISSTTLDLILANPVEMRQVIVNLCVNAEHAMRGTHGVLEVALENVEVNEGFTESHPRLKPGPYVRLTVSDTGHGIDRDTKERMFEPFFTTKKPDEGAGIGLSVVHRIVASHGGAIAVENGEGKGAQFHLYFPRLVSPLLPAASPTFPAINVSATA